MTEYQKKSDAIREALGLVIKPTENAVVQCSFEYQTAKYCAYADVRHNGVTKISWWAHGSNEMQAMQDLANKVKLYLEKDKQVLAKAIAILRSS